MDAISLDAIREAIPEPAKDLKLNLQSVLSESSLSVSQKYGVALASAVASRNHSLASAIQTEASAQAGEATVEDALAAAALMGMNNIYYRFRHMIGKESYSQLPARLRMQKLARPSTSKADFELFCLAVSAINGCEACVKAHEHTVLEAGLSEAQVNDAIRIAATVHGAAVALDFVNSVS